MIIVTKLKQRSQSAGNLLNFITLFHSACYWLTVIIVYLCAVRHNFSLCSCCAAYVNKATMPSALARQPKAEGSSETLRNKTKNLIKNVSVPAEHVPTHLKPTTDTEFGYYLAGLIKSDGSIIVPSYQSSAYTPKISIVFNSKDKPLALHLIKTLGYGSIQKVIVNQLFI